MVDFGDLSRKKVFEETKWLIYLICGGRGLGKMSPLVLSDVKELCLHSQAGTVDFIGEQGACHTVSTCIVFTQHFALPPAKDTHMCICCGKAIGEKRTSGSELKGSVFPDTSVLEKPFWLVYCFCEGIGVHAPGKGDLPFVGSQFKEFCCAGSTVLENPKENDVFCSTLGNFLCCWEECQMPPAKGNPKVACCTWKLNKEHGEASSDAPSGPKQINMT